MSSTKSDPTPIRALIQQSGKTFDSEVEASNLETVVRRRLRKLASQGDLWMLSSLLDRYLASLGDRLLQEDLSPQGVENVRGQILGIRNFFSDLLEDGEFPVEQQEGAPVRNPFERLTEADLDQPMILT